jgi:DNA-binding transcriptional LysR family regulator
MSQISFPGLRAFYEALRAGSIRAASDRLGVAPSSLSRQIHLLEHQMGAPLLERSSEGVVPTHSGRLVAEFARTVLLDYDSLRADINERRGIRQGFIRIAAVESTVSERVVSAIVTFRERFPEVMFQLRMLPAGKVVESVKLGEVDLGVTFCAAPDTSLTFLARFSEPIILALSPNHDWADRTSISISELKALALAMPEETFGVRRIVNIAAQANGIDLVPALVSDSFEALRGFARLSGGGAILPRLSIEAERKIGVLKAVRIDVPAFNETTADVIILKDRRPGRLLQLFFDEMRRVATSSR